MVGDAETAAEQEMRKIREPLTNLYGPYLVAGDTSLAAARQRLHTALEQTRQLRTAFTDRVYGKYRVCLHRPPGDQAALLAPILKDPATVHANLTKQMAAVRLEKDVEKKEAQKLNAEMAANDTAATTALNVDNAEQLMYLSAGLNLVILPENNTVDPLALRAYKERGPVNVETGQRVRAISQAAATAGEVMLDRTRKAAAMRVERQRRRQLQLLSCGGETAVSGAAAAADAAGSYSRLSVISRTTAAVTAARSATGMQAAGKALKKTAASSSKSAGSGVFPMPAPVVGKGGRSRGTVALSASALLSLNPAAEEINNNGKVSAATAALVARGVGASNNKTTQQRLRHPHPESLGGRRRATSNPGTALVNKQQQQPPEPFLQSYLALTLPPVPGTKERLERKPLAICSAQEASTPRAKAAVQSVLEQFAPVGETDMDTGNELGKVTKIRLLNGLRKRNNSDANETKLDATAGDATNVDTAFSSNSSGAAPVAHPAKVAAGGAPVSEGGLDPILTFAVLSAVGLISSSKGAKRPLSELSLRDINLEQGASEKLIRLGLRLSGETSSLTGGIMSTKLDQSKEEISSQECSRPTKRARVKKSDADVAGTTPMDVNVDAPSAVLTPPVASIRGGGGVLTTDDTNTSDERVQQETKVAGPPTEGTESGTSDVQSQRARSSSGESGTAQTQYQTAAAQLQHSDVTRLAYANAQMNASSAVGAHLQHHDQTLNALHLAQQLRQMQHPTGDLADYIGNLQQQQRHAGFEFSSLMPGAAMTAAQHSLATLGLAHVGYSMQDRAAAARAMYAREQQAAALLGSSYAQSTGSFNAHAAAVAALLGSSAQNALLGHGQFSMAQTGSPLQASLYQPAIEDPLKEGESQPPKDKAPTVSAKKAESRKPAPSKDPDVNSKKPTDTTVYQVSSNSTSLESVAVDTTEGTPTTKAVSGEATKENPKAAPKTAFDTSESDRDDAVATAVVDERGMKFFAPKIPSAISSDEATLIRAGKFNDVVSGIFDVSKRSAALEYLVSVGTAVPIPKALVAGPLKERLNTPGFKNVGGNGASTSLRDIAAASILVWLWAQHERNFQRTFEKSGRIDVDPDCKWLIQAAVDTAVRELTLEIADAVARGEGPFAEISAARKAQLSPKTTAPPSEAEKANVTKRVDIHTASTVSRALATELCIDGDMNNVIPKFQSLVEYLDESRMCALRAKSQERTLLAALIARKTTMVEPFSHAYVSAMVRAGEAVGHAKLFETVQDEDVMASTMIPYDIFTDESGSWEDPGRPDECFTSGLTGDDLMRRAHARAMIQKSLRKLQDRHSIRGGTQTFGPYIDASTAQSSAASSGAANSRSGQGFAAPRSGFKRRATSISEPPIPPGTGSAQAKTAAVYDPKHMSAPLDWDAEDIENSTYGRHAKGERARSLSLSLASRSGDPRSLKKTKRSMSMSLSAHSVGMESADGESPIHRSTYEIEWADVAGIFQNVELPKKATPAKGSHHEDKPAAKNIIAPFCLKVDSDDLVASEESDTEEDLSEETVLANHQQVLDDMKQKLSSYLEARKEQQESRKSKK